MPNLLTEMIMDYKKQGSRVDEVLFEEVMKVVDQSRKAENMLEKLYYEMGKSADADMLLWRDVKSHVKSGEPK